MSAITIDVIAGYLGAGKTTLINRLLGSDKDLNDVYVLVNDFGDINIDAGLIKSAHPAQDVIELTNGCVCCTVRDDLATQLDGLLAAQPQRLLLEASGVASPGKLRQQCSYPGYEPGPVTVVVDTETYPARTQDKYVGRLVQSQVGEADLLVLRGAGDTVPVAVDKATHTYESYIAGWPHPHVGANLEADGPETAFATQTWSPERAVVTEELSRLLQDSRPWLHRAKGVVHTEQGLTLVQLAGDTLSLSLSLSPTTWPQQQPGIVFIAPFSASEKLSELIARLNCPQ